MLVEQPRTLNPDDQKYTNYVDPSTIMIGHYQNHNVLESSQKYIQKIEQWLNTPCEKQANRPLVFSTQPGSGQISILTKWIKHHQNIRSPKGEKSMVVIHFASMGGNSTNYFYAIYRILIKLREALKIKQKVELLEEKIRKYFAYWLDVCGAELEKQLIVNETVDVYDKIIIVIEGIENFKDPETGRESNIAFWLPRCFPQNIKVIVTADSNSSALTHLVKLGSDIVPIQTSPETFEFLKTRFANCSSVLKSTLRSQLEAIFHNLTKRVEIRDNLSFFTQTYLNSIIIAKQGIDSETAQFLKDTVEKKLSTKELALVKSLGDLYSFVVDFWSKQFQFKFKELLLALIISQKGLRYQELQALSGMDEEGWKHFRAVFRFCLIGYKSMYMIQDQAFKATVMLKFSIKEETVKEFHQKIADVLEETPNSIRKLQQQTYHLYVSKCYFKLKEKISNIENFLLLFNPDNKYDFSRYWQKLEEKGFDPVIEYNKAIEGFSMHYHPTEESIFRIIVQISRFLKEFCDFETYYTPNFRHPPIEGSMMEMDKIGLLKELEKLEIFVDSSCSKQERVISHPSLTEQINELKAKYFLSDVPERKDTPADKAKDAERTAPKSYLKDSERKTSLSSSPILTEIEQLNVDVPKNRQKFRAYYVNLLKDFMEKKESKDNQNLGQFYLEDDIELETEESKALKKERHPDIKIIKIRQNFNTAQVKPSLYYYKRWIWIQFPWACISLHKNYSKTPQLCLTSATEYMSVETEAEFTRQALKIAIEAKERKRMMFAQKVDTGLDQSNKVQLRTSKSQFKFESGDIKMKTISGTSVFSALKSINLNLQSLTKQLQVKRNKYQDKSQSFRKFQLESSTFALTEARQKEQDFIQKRKAFAITSPNSIVKSELLPKIKSQIKDHTIYELNYLNAHIEEKKKSINQIVYENTKLEKVYKELKIKEWQSNECVSFENKKFRNFQELERKKDSTITEFCKSLLQKERLKIILKLCSENKTRNEEYLTSLNYLLQNLKKMIFWQKGDMEKLHAELQQIQQLNELTKEAVNEKEHNEEILSYEIQMALEAKSKFQDQITQMSMVINEEVNNSKSKFEDNISGDRLKNQQKNKQLQLERNAKLIEDELETMERNYSQVAVILNITDFNFRDSEKFQQLMQEKEKNKQLNLILFEKSNKLEELKFKIQKSKGSVTNNGSQATVSPILRPPKSEGKQLQYLKDANLKYKIGFQNLSLRLRLKDKSQSSVLQQISSRLRRFKGENEHEYNKMMTSNGDSELSQGYSEFD